MLAPSIKYLAPVEGTSNKRRPMILNNDLKAMVISIVFSTDILLLSELLIEEDEKVGRD